MITLMIVDDHPMVREGLEAMLMSEEGFSVVALAKNGEEAIALAAEKKPDIVLSDIRMPKMDGLTLLERLHAAQPGVKVLLLAGMPLKEEEARARWLKLYTEAVRQENAERDANRTVEAAAASVEITSQEVEDVLNVGKMIFKAVERD